MTYIPEEEAQSIIKRIKKLMALSTSSNINEAAAAAAKAQELLIKYNVDMDQVENVSLDREDKKLRKEFVEIFGANAVNVIEWKKALAYPIARANLCQGVGSGKGMYFLGRQANIEVTKFMYETVVHQVEMLADKAWKSILALRELQEANPHVKLFTDHSLKTVHGKTWKAAFYAGAVETIKARLEENLEELKLSDANTMALVTTETKDLKSFMKQEFGNLGNFRMTNRSEYQSAYGSGKLAGNKVQFVRGVGGSTVSGPALLGKGNN